MSLSVKAGVRFDQGVAMAVLITVMNEAFARLELNRDCTITSGVDGVHKRNSLHYTGRALDIRSRDLTLSQQQTVVAYAKSRLGPNFDIILEGDHIHAEWDPK